MPPKSVPSIKSITKKDTLTLVCEWDQCQDVFNQFDNFMVHITEHITELYHLHSSSEDPDALYKCDWRDCGHDTFPGFQEIMRHINFHAFHVKIKSQGMILLLKNQLRGCLMDAASGNMIPELPDRLVCAWAHCQSVFDNPVEFYSHVRNHCDCFPDGNKPPGGCRCEWEGCAFIGKSKHKVKDHMRSHTQEKFIACPTCGGLFSNSTKFFDHIKRQTQSDVHSYQCSHCNKRFSSERLLRDHMRHHVNHYKCPFCDMTCPNPSGLRTHMRYRHTEDRPHACAQCEYRAKTAIDLRRHVDSHKPEGTECEFENCKFKCKTYWDMNAHYKLKHEGGTNEQGSSKYMCHLCGNTYWCGNKLTDHLRRKHKFKWPSGHTRFRYKVHEDGYYRLQTVRYESIELTEQMLHNRMEEHGLSADGSCEGATEGGAAMEDLSNKSPMKTVRAAGSPHKTVAKHAVLSSKLGKRRLETVDEQGEEEPLAGESTAPVGKVRRLDMDERESGGRHAGGTEADYSYNLEMLGDVALQNSDVHSSQEFAATSTPLRPTAGAVAPLADDSDECEDSPPDHIQPVGGLLTDFEQARMELGVFTPVKHTSRGGLSHLPQDYDVITEGGNILDAEVFTKVLTVSDRPPSAFRELDTGEFTSDAAADSQSGTVLHSGTHKILVTSDVPVKFTRVVKVLDSGQVALSDDPSYVIQELGSAPNMEFESPIGYSSHSVDHSGKRVVDCSSGDADLVIQRKGQDDSNQSMQTIEDDILNTAQELGISIQS